MKAISLFRKSKHQRLFVWIYTLAAIIGFPLMIFVVALHSGLFHEFVQSIRWQHLARITVVSNVIVIFSISIIAGSLVQSTVGIWKRFFTLIVGVLFILLFFSNLRGGLYDLQNGIQTYIGGCRFDGGERTPGGELYFTQIAIGIYSNLEGGHTLSIPMKTSNSIEKVTFPGNINRRVYTLCKHPIHVSYLKGLEIALIVKEDVSTNINYFQR